MYIDITQDICCLITRIYQVVYIDITRVHTDPFVHVSHVMSMYITWDISALSADVSHVIHKCLMRDK